MNKFRISWIVIVGIVTAAFLTYKVTDNRKTDSSVPVFSMEKKELEVSIHDGEDVLLQGIDAVDEKDGDVTDSILIEKISNIYGDGKRIVTYAAFDSDNHVSEAEREITYTDYTSPRFELTGSLRFRSGSTIDIDKIVKAWDCLDGDISSNVKIQLESSINNRVTGLYDMVYQVTNSAGDMAELPVQFEIYQPADNEVILNLTEYLAYYDGSDINYADYLKNIEVGNITYPFEGTSTGDSEEEPEDGESAGDSENDTDAEDSEVLDHISRDRVKIQSYVDTNVPGVYPVYFYYESASYVAAEVMYVVVE